MNLIKNNLRKVIIITSSVVFTIFYLTLFILPTSRSASHKYTVSFDSKGGSEVSAIKVEKGRKLPDMSAPTKTYAGTEADVETLFTGWYKDSFAIADVWNTKSEIVTKDLTLYAGWINLGPTPIVGKTAEIALSNTIEWKQKGLDAATTVKVIADLDNDGTFDPATETLAGTAKVLDDEVTMHYELDEAAANFPAGGSYNIQVTTQITGGTDKTAVFNGLRLNGNGTQTKPYTITKAIDVMAINNPEVANATVGTGKFYSLENDITDVKGHNRVSKFDGTLLGNFKSITLENGSTGLINVNMGTIKELQVIGAVSTGTRASTGLFADINEGTIQSVLSGNGSNQIENVAGITSDITTATQGGAGGIVGTNKSTGIIKDATNNSRVRGNIAIGGIVGINEGQVTNVVNFGRIGAGNTATTGTSGSKYSYMGGVAGINYGKINNAISSDDATKVTAGFTIASALHGNAGNISTQLDEGNDPMANKAIGGIVGYNAATGEIDDASYDADFVHGDNGVGGIVGINDGKINNVSVDAGAVIGGGNDIGAIVGKENNASGTTNVTDNGATVNTSRTRLNTLARKEEW